MNTAMRALEALTDLQTRGLMTDALIINPIDWQEIIDRDKPRTPKTRLWNQPVILSDQVQRGRPMAATWGMGR
jgi:hypothetical protein